MTKNYRTLESHISHTSLKNSAVLFWCRLAYFLKSCVTQLFGLPNKSRGISPNVASKKKKKKKMCMIQLWNSEKTNENIFISNSNISFIRYFPLNEDQLKIKIYGHTSTFQKHTLLTSYWLLAIFIVLSSYLFHDSELQISEIILSYSVSCDSLVFLEQKNKIQALE